MCVLRNVPRKFTRITFLRQHDCEIDGTLVKSRVQTLHDGVIHLSPLLQK